LLLMDELLDGLDPNSFHQLSKAILGPDKPWTVVLVTRDSEVTQLCQPIIKLSSCHLTDGSDSSPSA
jgi:ABC-type phosphate transport system ATPase subunit